MCPYEDYRKFFILQFLDAVWQQLLYIIYVLHFFVFGMPHSPLHSWLLSIWTGCFRYPFYHFHVLISIYNQIIFRKFTHWIGSWKVERYSQKPNFEVWLGKQIVRSLCSFIQFLRVKKPKHTTCNFNLTLYKIKI